MKANCVCWICIHIRRYSYTYFFLPTRRRLNLVHFFQYKLPSEFNSCFSLQIVWRANFHFLKCNHNLQLFDQQLSSLFSCGYGWICKNSNSPNICSHKFILANSNKNQAWILLKWQLFEIWTSVHKYFLKTSGQAPLNSECFFLCGVEYKR